MHRVHGPRLAPKRMSEVVSPIFGKILCIYEGKGKRWHNNTKVRSLSPPISLGFTGFPGWLGPLWPPAGRGQTDREHGSEPLKARIRAHGRNGGQEVPHRLE